MRVITATAVACLALGGICTAHDAEASIKHRTDIPAQPLAPALQTLVKEHDIQLVYRAELIGDRTTGGAAGALTAVEALGQLLDGTGLTYRYLDDKTITILPIAVTAGAAQGGVRPPSARSASSSTSPNQGATTPANASGGKSFWDRFRLAQVDQGSSVSGSQSDQGQKTIDLEEIVVTGTHIRGLRNNTVPLTVLDRAYIDGSGYTTTAQLIESLPQNLASVNRSAPAGLTEAGTVGNQGQGASINLRGIGQGTTLILLNGRRLAPGMGSSSVDISALPLSMIERVEVLTDGASALYGSDAIGGVVNFILRQDFDGAETRVLAGTADPVDEYRVSQAFGKAWNSGNIAVSGQYHKRDILLAKDRSYVPSSALIGSLLPEDKDWSFMGTGKQELSKGVSVFADGLYSNRDSYNFGDIASPTLGFLPFRSKTKQIAADAGINWDVGGDWRVVGAGNYAKNESLGTNNRTNRILQQVFELWGGQITADGTLGQLPGGALKLALGTEWRKESYPFVTINRVTGAPTTGPFKLEQQVRSAHAELYIPIVGSSNRLSGVRTLEVSIAARHDDYSSFGSSTDPQLGIMWEPTAGIRVRATRGSSYKPPNLTQYASATNQAVAIHGVDPILQRTSYQLRLQGFATGDYRPQTADTWSIGLDWVPASIESLRLGANYYKIDYTDRLAIPGGGNPSIILSDPNAYASVITRDPTAAEVSAAIATGTSGGGFTAFGPNNSTFVTNPANFDPSLVNVIVDTRTRNLSVTRTSGLDLYASHALDLWGGSAQLGINATHVFELVNQITATSPSVDSVATIYSVPKWRARGTAGWQRDRWSTNLAVNYLDSLTDTRRRPLLPVASYVTVDTRIAHELPDHLGVLSKTSLAISAVNLFDKDPPRAAVYPPNVDVGFDPLNASPLGRMVSIELSKAW